jgi:hypothetical protein
MAVATVPIILSLLSLLIQVDCVEYYVSINDGSDDNPGTIAEPFQHVQKAVSVLKAGDVCNIRGGVYHEEVIANGLKGSPDQPIIFKSYNGEKVTFDGTTVIKGEWDVYHGNIYVTKLDFDIWQLFVDEEMQINARWPNAFWYDYSVFDYTTWGFSSSLSTYNLEEGIGLMIDNGTKNLAKSGLNAKGAIAILNIGQWLTWAGQVTHHAIGNNSFEYSLDPKPRAVHFIPRNCRYFLEDKLEFLDSPSEWYYNPIDKQLYLWLKSSDSPDNHDIRGKTSTYAFTINHTSSWVVLEGLDFFATTVYIRGVDNIKLDTCHFSYPSYSMRMLGSTAVPNTTTIYFGGLLKENSGNFTVTNCIWEYGDGQTINYRGADGVFINNLWHHNDFTCVGDGGLFHSAGVRDKFIRNTVHSNGPSVGFSPGAGTVADRALGLPTGADVRLNLFYDLKYLQNDGAHVQTQIAVQNGTILEYNWCYDTMKWGLRFDRVNQDNASWGYNGTMRYNVVWGTKGMRLKGDDHSCHNNLAFNSSSYYDIALFGYPGDGVKGENIHTYTTDNILEHGACSSLQNTSHCTNIPGTYKNNIVGDINKVIRDPDNWDFRPLSDHLDVLPIGPYGIESMKHGGVYWIPGRQEIGATMPIPLNGSVTARCDAHLMWLGGYGAHSHNVYFGTDNAAVKDANTSSPEFKSQMDIPANIVDPGELVASRYYYWRVDVLVESVVVHTGPVWWFKCI